MAGPVKHPADRVNVLGVGVDLLTVGDLQAEVGRLVRGGRGGLVLNVNVHCLNLCYADPALRGFFNAADVVFCDGAGVMLAAMLLGRSIPERITYADWAWDLAAFAAADQESRTAAQPSGDVVEDGAASEGDAGVEPVPVLHQPVLLERHPEAD